MKMDLGILRNVLNGMKITAERIIRSRFLRVFLVMIVPPLVCLSGCGSKFFDPSQVGRFRPVPAVNVILDSLGVAEETPAAWEGAEEQTDSGVAVDLNNVSLKMVWTATSVEFYIDNVLVATHTTRVPDTPLTSELLVRTDHPTDGRYLYIDKVEAEVI